MDDRPPGRLERVEPGSVWKDEPAGFTPWLARQENFRLLGEALRLDLKPVAREHGVGSFRTDLPCRVGGADRGAVRAHRAKSSSRGERPGPRIKDHLDIVVAGGGDTRSVVELAVDRRRRRNDTRIPDSGALVFLDADRLAAGRAAGRDPEAVPGLGDLRPVFLGPKLEGLLIRIHRACEAHFPAAEDAEKRLRELWPNYRKPMSAAALGLRFSLDDFRRSARHDPDLRAALRLPGLLP